MKRYLTRCLVNELSETEWWIQLKISIENSAEICRTKKTRRIVIGLAQILRVDSSPVHSSAFAFRFCQTLCVPFDFVGMYVCTCTYVAYRHRAWKRSSIVLFHRARLVGGPKPRLSCIHWVYRIVSEIPGALKLALRNNSAVSKARAHSRAGCSLTLNAFIYFDCVHRVHPRITCAVRSSRALRLACAFYARGFVENGI